MSSESKRPPNRPDSWPPGGEDPALVRLQARHLPGLEKIDIPGLLRDPLLGRTVIVASFGTESAVMLHYVSGILPGIPVIFLNTGMHFAETLAYRERLAGKLPITLIDIHPDAALLAEGDPSGKLHLHDADSCCRIRKTFPLQDALEGYDTWISGRKRFQGGTRSALPVIERDGPRIKVNPLVHWTLAEVAAYFQQHGLPQHPLAERGFRSVGCAPCTRPVSDGENTRAGRWPQMPEKIECGIHLGPDGTLIRTRN